MVCCQQALPLATQTTTRQLRFWSPWAMTARVTYVITNSRKLSDSSYWGWIAVEGLSLAIAVNAGADMMCWSRTINALKGST